MIAKLKQFVSSFSLLVQPEFVHTALFEQDISTKQMEIFLRVFQNLSSLKDLDEILSYLLGEIHKLVQVDCGVFLFKSEQTLEVRSHRGFSENSVREFRIHPGQDILGEIFLSGRSMIFSKRDFPKLQRFEKAIAEEGWESVFATALTIQNQNIGLFVAGSKEPLDADGKKVQFLERFAQMVALSIEQVEHLEKVGKFNRRLEAEVAATTQELLRTNDRLIQRVRELKSLYEVTSAIASSQSLAQIMEVACSKLEGLLNMESIGFFLAGVDGEESSDLGLLPSSFHLSKDMALRCRIEKQRLPEYGLSAARIYEAFQTGQVRIFQGVSVALRKELAIEGAVHSELESVVFHSFIAVPLKTARRNLGVMVLVNPMKDSTFALEASEEFGDEKVRTLTLVAARIASSIESVLQGQEIQMRLGDLSTLQEISQAFYATPVFEFVLAKIIKIMLKSLHCDVCTFLFYDPASRMLLDHMPRADEMMQSAAGVVEGFALGENSVSFAVFREKKSRQIDDIEFYEMPVRLNRQEFEQDVHSMLLIPLKVENEVIGVLRLGDRAKAAFNQHHMRLAELIADRAAVIIQNARLYEKVLQANKELENLNRVKTEFVSMVSHELRTPVTAVKGFVDIVLNEEVGEINDQQKKFLKIAHNAIERLTLLISDLLDISRIESGRLKLDLSKLSLLQVLHDASETHRSVMEAKKIKLAFSEDKKIPQIQADPTRIRQVVDNLLSNAIKFMPVEGGTLRLDADDMGDFVLISVQDTGIGIKKEDQDKIFEKFYQADSSLTRQAGGSGLGLAICKAIIEMHGGRIWVESEFGKGATFRFLLPCAREKKSGITKIDRSA